MCSSWPDKRPYRPSTNNGFQMSSTASIRLWVSSPWIDHIHMAYSAQHISAVARYKQACSSEQGKKTHGLCRYAGSYTCIWLVLCCSRELGVGREWQTDRGRWKSRDTTHALLESMPRGTNMHRLEPPASYLWVCYFSFWKLGVCFQKPSFHTHRPLNQHKTRCKQSVQMCKCNTENRKEAKCDVRDKDRCGSDMSDPSWNQGVLKTTCSPLPLPHEKRGPYYMLIDLYLLLRAWGLSMETTTLPSSSRASVCVLLHVHATIWLQSLEHCEFEQYTSAPGFSSQACTSEFVSWLLRSDDEHWLTPTATQIEREM